MLHLTFMSEMDSSFCWPLGFFFWKSSIRFLMLVPISPKFKYKFWGTKEIKRNHRLTINELVQETPQQVSRVQGKSETLKILNEQKICQGLTLA